MNTDVLLGGVAALIGATVFFLTVSSPIVWERLQKRRRRKQRFCTECGNVMLDGYWIMERRYSPDTGMRQERRIYGRMCMKIAGKDFETIYNEDYDHHDGFSRSSKGVWGDV